MLLLAANGACAVDVPFGKGAIALAFALADSASPAPLVNLKLKRG